MEHEHALKLLAGKGLSGAEIAAEVVPIGLRIRNLCPLKAAAKQLAVPPVWISGFLRRRKLRADCQWNGREFLFEPAQLFKLIVENRRQADVMPADPDRFTQAAAGAKLSADSRGVESVNLRELFRAERPALDLGADDHRADDHRADDHRADDHRADDHRADDHRADDHRAAGLPTPPPQKENEAAQ